ncbi:SART-1 family protein DOT2-like [Triticum dicoccoides]|uniref:SART-1 family protein DOT2-like n=1 Tax=Triticum dicoccoides TaxID=85692 RepID=UPI000E79A829|nr:SART-1 family protein DOT2-like [Triticum dicoccoides]
MGEKASESLRQGREEAPRKQQHAAACGPLAVAGPAIANEGRGDAPRSKIVITEMDEFVLGLQLNAETCKREARDVFADEDDGAASSGTLSKDDKSGSAARKMTAGIEDQVKDGEDAAVKPDEVLHEAEIGKGLAGALRLLKDRGTLDEGGEKISDKKKSKPVGIKDGPKEINIERTDEFGRVMTMKEAFRELSRKFHGKGPGKTKQEKRQRKYQDELKTKRMKSSDTPLMSAEKMREAQARNKTPYLVLSGNARSRHAG